MSTQSLKVFTNITFQNCTTPPTDTPWNSKAIVTEVWASRALVSPNNGASIHPNNGVSIQFRKQDNGTSIQVRIQDCNHVKALSSERVREIREKSIYKNTRNLE